MALWTYPTPARHLGENSKPEYGALCTIAHVEGAQLNADELDQQIAGDIETIQADIDAYDERHSIQDESPTNEQTTERALKALQRPERFRGEHAVARAWLTHHALRIWTLI